MANDSLEYDIIVNGKQAKRSIEDVEQAQENLEKSVKKTSKEINISWTKIGVGVAAVATALVGVAKQGIGAEKAMFGLNKEMQNYAMHLSTVSDFTTAETAGFIRTAQSAGVAKDQIKEMVDMAIALGRAYPHESTETFIDNLSMLYTSGEAQGYIVDILEQKYGTLDLKSVSLADKMKVLKEKSDGINESWNKMASVKIDKIFGGIANAFDKLGKTMLNWIDKVGIFDAIIGKFEQWNWVQKETQKETKKTADTLKGASIEIKYQKTLWDEIASGIYNFSLTSKQALSEYQEGLQTASKYQEELAQVGQRAMGSLENTLVDMAMTGKLSFRDMADSIARDLMKIQMRQMVVRPLAEGLSGMDFFAQGGVFNGGVKQRFAQGGVVSQPTKFRFAQGTGLMGEAGAEAIMPLTRTKNGDLGVKVDGGGAGNVKVEIINESGQPMQTKSAQAMQDPSGMIISVVMDGYANNRAGMRDLLGGNR